MQDERERAMAERVRDACIRAALDAYEDAGVQGLCAEGRWEAAVAAMRRVALPPAEGDATTPGAGPSARTG